MQLIEELNKFNDIIFNDELHIYTSKTKNIKYISATGLVSSIEQFDTIEIANKQADELGVSVQNILDNWELNKKYASNLGSEIHKYIELYWQNKIYFGDTNVFNAWKTLNLDMQNDFNLRTNNYNNYHKSLIANFIALKNEFVIYDETYGVAGMIDLLCYEKTTSNIYIFDWKSSKEIKKENPYQKLNFPLSKYDNCNFITYSLQLSIYKTILEMNTNLKIKDMYLIHILANQPCKAYKCYNLQNEALKLMKLYKEKNNGPIIH